MLERLFNKVVGLKRDSKKTLSCGICGIFKNIYFEEHLRTAGFERIPNCKPEASFEDITNFCQPINLGCYMVLKIDAPVMVKG